jgi:hypothetical protein
MQKSNSLWPVFAAFTTTTLPVRAGHHEAIASIVEHNQEWDFIYGKEVKDVSTPAAYQ